MSFDPANLIEDWRESPWADFPTAWALTTDAPRAVATQIAGLGSDYRVCEGVAVHRSATVEERAVLKAPCMVGPECFVAHNAYLRGGVWLADRVIVGPSCEVKTCFLFPGSKIAHLSFVGDSVLGGSVNIEAGAIVANYRNESATKAVRIVFEGGTVETGSDKFGALLGDRVRVGANAVIAPGAIIKPDTVLPRLALHDQSPEASGDD
ncbi:transferase [Erythrobacter sp.]|uniref:transferase n=1 Tax=Erythrobacter sp. TaxID=1042 RepID=UPI001B0D9C9E|nr:transferase [Erythrobacter sp.]MBO6525854.1 transferase [Erythrobacter sp.]MBO6529471.1 transferase [Erythrobacter sp.]